MRGHNEFLNCPDDTSCVHCGQRLPENPKKDSWEWNGYCDAECATYYILAHIGIAPGKEPPRNIGRTTRDELLAAVAGLASAYRRELLATREQEARDTFEAEARLNLDPTSEG